MYPHSAMTGVAPIGLHTRFVLPLLVIVSLSGCLAPRTTVPCGDKNADPKLCPPTAPARSDGSVTGSAASDGPGAADPGAADPFQASECPAGSHICAGVCVDSSDPSHCGFACVACPSLTGGNSTCDSVKCGVECPPGQKPCIDKCVDQGAACDSPCPPGTNACNGICVDATSVSACGTACVTCPTSTFGQTTCDGDQCVLTCSEGHHACGNNCVLDNDPLTCGTGCSPCTVPVGGTATCDGAMCGASCPAGMTLCKGECLPAGKSCDTQCPAGSHDCAGNCVPDNDTANCGGSCTPCGLHPNAKATCEGGKCDFKCSPGFHRCGDQCVDNKSINSCGPTSCSPCPTGAGATATCDGTKCDLKCGVAAFLCNGACQECCNSGQCGKKGNQVAACTGGVCQYACPAGQKLCGNNTCGTCCSDTECPAGAACANGTCKVAANCKDGSIKCSNGQVCNIGTGKCENCPTGQKGCLGNVCRECCDTTDCTNGRMCDGTFKCVDKPSCVNQQVACGPNQICNIASASCTNCPTGQKACGNVCRACCGNGDCKDGFMCTNFTCQEKASCKNGKVTCAKNQICDIASAACMACPAGQRGCLNNICRECCDTNDCPSGRMCDGNFRCVDKPSCVNGQVTCAQNQICNTASATCMNCPNGQFGCRGNVCQPCCEEGQCKTGFMCVNFTCQEKASCKNGQVTCAQNQICDIGKATCVNCAPGQRGCKGNVCRECCDTNDCPSGRMCDGNFRCVDKPSCVNGQVTCAQNQICNTASATCTTCPNNQFGCKGNVCRQCCEEGQCKAGSTCTNFTCQEKASCKNGQVTCTNDQICDIASATCKGCGGKLHACKGNVCRECCDSTQCPDNSLCTSGGTCQAQKTCKDGSLTCKTNQICNIASGQCKDCPAGQMGCLGNVCCTP
jgi:hypothetical protein